MKKNKGKKRIINRKLRNKIIAKSYKKNITERNNEIKIDKVINDIKNSVSTVLKGLKKKIVVYVYKSIKNIKSIAVVLSKKTNEIILFLKKKHFSDWQIIGVVLVVVMVVFAMNIHRNVMNNKKIEEQRLDILNYPKGVFDGNKFLTNVYPIFKDVMVIGDSYSHFLALDVGFDLRVFARPGLTLRELRSVFECAIKSEEKYAVIFIGPNDLMSQTDTQEFKSYLLEYVNKLKDNNKTVLIATYLHSEYTDEAKKRFEGGFTVDDYDRMIQDVCDETKSKYINLKNINNYHDDKRIESNGIIDPLHFNQQFNIKFINKVYEYLYDMILEEK